MVAEALLVSWRDTPARKAITDFVQGVTSEGSAGYVAPADRVAVFDNDGTLWSEKPIPIQLDFTLFRMAELAQADSSLRDRQPYRAAVERDYRWLGEAMVKHYHGDDADLRLLMAAVGGHALYVKDNRLHYVNNFVGTEQKIVGSEDIPTGHSVILSASFEKTGLERDHAAGTLSLYHGDRKVGEAQIKTQLGALAIAGASLYVGRHPGEPVTDD